VLYYVRLQHPIHVWFPLLNNNFLLANAEEKKEEKPIVEEQIHQKEHITSNVEEERPTAMHASTESSQRREVSPINNQLLLPDDTVKPKTVEIFSPLVLRQRDRFILIVVGLSTAGLGSAILYPFFSFERYRSNIPKMRIAGKRFKFTGDLWEFYKVSVTNYVFSVLTLGLYWFLGYSDRRITDYVESHTEEAV